jgi:rod shape-determining protein MreC
VRNIFELLYYFRELLFLCLAILISIMLLLTGESRQSFALQGWVASVVAGIPRPDLGIDDIISYKEENEVLRQRLMRYALLNAELADVARENERLREMLQFTEESPYHLQVAEVISRGASSIISTITLNVGLDHDIKPNLPVLSLDGLLGKTMTVTQSASVVQLITDRNFRVSVKVGSQGVRGILVPVSGHWAEITGIPHGSGIEAGDQVFTSGFSEIYPKNLPIAEVKRVEEIAGDNFCQVRVLIHTEPSKAEHVFVMVGHDADT